MCISNIGIIELDEMRFWAYHGCMPDEKAKGNLFLVDFRGEMDLTKAASSDALADTVNYGEIYQIVKAQMSQPSDLLEHVAGRIIKALSENFPEFVKFSVRVSKRKPPVDGHVQWSRVTLYFNKD